MQKNKKKRHTRKKISVIKLSTLKLDKEILCQLQLGYAPKEVSHAMGLKNKWRIYDATRRQKQREGKI